ncbi:uncharacterized protein LOC117282488 [Cryptotermes secundus]|uniref:uncharacterized protein LOC117282488 n=1 Tax=Cryptotermes secundus TaxID=105785 RepID=UPI001454CDE9|nr:uncharacterized protein LOC117282488 [Cryptotermes secundus]
MLSFSAVLHSNSSSLSHSQLHKSAPPHGCPSQQCYTATAAASATLSCTSLPHHMAVLSSATQQQQQPQPLSVAQVCPTTWLSFSAVLHSNSSSLSHSQLHKSAPPHGCPQQCYTATAAASATLSCTSLPHHSGRNKFPLLRHNQTPNVNSMSLTDMFKVVATIFQQIMIELNGAESEEDGIMAILKFVLKLMKQNGC